MMTGTLTGLIAEVKVNAHYVIDTDWDNLGNGWRMHCNCGWCTIPERSLQNAGRDMDRHFRLFNAAPAKRGGGAGE